MKAIDIITPKPKTEIERWYQWLNRLQSEAAPLRNPKKINIKYIGDEK